jgi:hypothetical protein
MEPPARIGGRVSHRAGDRCAFRDWHGLKKDLNTVYVLYDVVFVNKTI